MECVRKLTIYINSCISTVIVMVILYYSHRILQLQVYRYCKFDLFRIIFFNQSPMCIHANNILAFVESAGQYVSRHLMSILLTNGFTANAFMRLGNYDGILTVGFRTFFDMLYKSVFHFVSGRDNSARTNE